MRVEVFEAGNGTGYEIEEFEFIDLRKENYQ